MTVTTSTSQYRSLIWLVLKFRYRSILKLFRAELTAYGVRDIAHLVTCVMKMLPPIMVTYLDMR